VGSADGLVLFESVVKSMEMGSGLSDIGDSLRESPASTGSVGSRQRPDAAKSGVISR
jgi:hypothetical protein